MRAVRESGGTAIAVSDDEIMKASENLASNEGLFVAPEGGACIAALKKLRDSNFLRKSDRILIYNTGSGYKYIDVWSKYYGFAPATMKG